MYALTVRKFQPLKNVEPEYDVSSRYCWVAAAAGWDNNDIEAQKVLPSGKENIVNRIVTRESLNHQW